MHRQSLDGAISCEVSLCWLEVLSHLVYYSLDTCHFVFQWSSYLLLSNVDVMCVCMCVCISVKCNRRCRVLLP